MSTTESEEVRLSQAAQAGDASAFQILVHQHLPAIHGYCLKMLGNHSDAADTSQEVFIKLWQSFDQYDSEKAKLSTWLHQIAHNLCIDTHRRHTRQNQLSLEVKNLNCNTGCEYSESIESQDDQETRGKRLNNAIEMLPERQRSALLFCHHQGLSNKQAAEILEVSVDALESLLSRARRSLKNALMEQSND